MQTKYLITLALIFTVGFAQAQGVGIGIPAPDLSAMLHVNTGTTGKGLLVTGTNSNTSTIPDLGAGSRLMFFPGKAAFRAGYVEGTAWDNINVGRYSVAMGYYTIARGANATAIGSQSTASGVISTAMGELTISSGYASTALGSQTSATSLYSTAMGFNTTSNNLYSTSMGYGTIANGSASTSMGNSTSAAGNNSTSIGYFTSANGTNSTAMGSGTSASGNNSTAMGYLTIASGNNSTGMGYSAANGDNSTSMGFNTVASGANSTSMGSYVNTNSYKGAFIIGDSDPNNEGATISGNSDEMVARFWNGYYFLTSGNNTRFGVQIGHNGNAWVSICDKNRKENFEPVDGDGVLQKIAKMNFTSWNYKQQDAKTYRHYGIMAQDFYNAFGHDEYGTIGNDTTVNPIDMIGIDMAAIQALEKRTTVLKNEIAKLKNQNLVLRKTIFDIEALKKENENLRQSVAQLQNDFIQQQKLMAQSLNSIKALTVTQTEKETVAIK